MVCRTAHLSIGILVNTCVVCVVEKRCCDVGRKFECSVMHAGIRAQIFKFLQMIIRIYVYIYILNVYIYIYTYIHTYINTCMHAYVHIHT